MSRRRHVTALSAHLALATLIAVLALGLIPAVAQSVPRNFPICINLARQFTPKIYGNNVVWVDERSGTNVYMRNIATGIESRVTTSSGDVRQAEIWGSNVVWEAYTGPTDPDIYIRNLATGRASRLTTASAQYAPAISGNRVVWEDNRNGNSDIYMHDLATGHELRLTTNTADQETPAIWGNKVVWEDNRNGPIGNDDIYMRNLTTGVESQVTTDPAQQFYAAVSGDRVVWEDRRNGNDDVYMRNLATGRESQITTDTTSQWDPVIWGTKVVWTDWRNDDGSMTNSDIYMRDLTTGVERQLTTDTARQELPAIWGKTVVWQDRRNGNYNEDVYGADVRIRARLSTPSGPRITHLNSRFASQGYLSPMHARGAYSVQIRGYHFERGRWILRRRVSARNSNYYSLTKYRAGLWLQYRGAWRLRAQHEDVDHLPSYSGYRYVRVR